MSGKLRLKRKEFTDDEWDELKDMIVGILSDHASRKETIPYSDLTKKINLANKKKDYEIHHRGKVLKELLGEISRAEHEADRGMLSVLVVYKRGKEKLGQGFYDQAWNEFEKYLGWKEQTPEWKALVWKKEFKTVTNYWQKHPPGN